MLSNAYNIVIDCGFGSSRNGKDFVYGLKPTKTMFLKMLITTVKLPSAATNYSHMIMHTPMSSTYISIARVFQNIFHTQHVHMDLLIMEKTGNELVKVNGHSLSILFSREKMYITNQ